MYQAGSELAFVASCKVTFVSPNSCSLIHRRLEQCSLLYPEDNEQCVHYHDDVQVHVKYAPDNRELHHLTTGRATRGLWSPSL